MHGKTTTRLKEVERSRQQQMLDLPPHDAFEPRLFEPKSPLPGNGIFRAETKRPKRL